MLRKLSLQALIMSTLCTQLLTANDLKDFNGDWHLRVMDGMEVRKARAILDFDMEKMKLSGFDSCNRISGELIKHSDTNITAPLLISTRMACRDNIHNWVSQRLHETLKEGFQLKAESKYGIEGITLKSPTHELFLKRMEKEK